MSDATDVGARLERYERMLTQDPANAGLIAQVVDLRLQAGDLKGARSALDDALALSPHNPGFRSQKASLAMAAGEPAIAIHVLESMLAEGIESPILRYNLAYAYLYTGDHRAAETALRGILDAPEAPADTPLLLARVLHHFGDLDEAARFATQYLNKFPQDSKALGYLALLALDAENLSDAKQWSDRALAADPDNLEGLVTRGSLALEEQDQPTAKTLFEQATARHPKSGRAWGGLALSEMLSMELERAKEHLALSVRYMPNHIGTWHVLAWCNIALNDHAGARDAFTKALELNRNFSETHGGLAVVDILEGRMDEAEKGMRRALKLDPNSFAGRFAQSLLLTHAGNTHAAQQGIREILRTQLKKDGPLLEESLAKIFRQRDHNGKKN